MHSKLRRLEHFKKKKLVLLNYCNSRSEHIFEYILEDFINIFRGLNTEGLRNLDGPQIGCHCTDIVPVLKKYYDINTNTS